MAVIKNQFNKLTEHETDVLNQYEILRVEREAIRQKFADVLNSAESNVLILTDKLPALKEQKQEIYTMFVLGEVTVKAYKDAETAVLETEESLQMETDKIVNIIAIEKQEVEEKIRDKMKPITGELSAIRNRNQAIIREELRIKKREYLETFGEARSQLYHVMQYEDFEEDVRVYVGDQKNAYRGLDDPFDHLLSRSYDNMPGVDIPHNEARDAFNRN